MDLQEIGREAHLEIHVASFKYHMLVVVNAGSKNIRNLVTSSGTLGCLQRVLLHGVCMKFTSCDCFQCEVLCSQFLVCYLFSIYFNSFKFKPMACLKQHLSFMSLVTFVIFVGQLDLLESKHQFKYFKI